MDRVNLWYFKIWLFDLTDFIIWNIRGLRHQRPNKIMVGSTSNCIQCFEVWAGAQLEPFFCGSVTRFNLLKFGFRLQKCKDITISAFAWQKLSFLCYHLFSLTLPVIFVDLWTFCVSFILNCIVSYGNWRKKKKRKE